MYAHIVSMFPFGKQNYSLHIWVSKEKYCLCVCVCRLRAGDKQALQKLSYEDLQKLEEEVKKGLRGIHHIKVTYMYILL